MIACIMWRAVGLWAHVSCFGRGITREGSSSAGRTESQTEQQKNPKLFHFFKTGIHFFSYIAPAIRKAPSISKATHPPE